MLCLGLQPGSAEMQGQTDQLINGGRPYFYSFKLVTGQGKVFLGVYFVNAMKICSIPLKLSCFNYFIPFVNFYILQRTMKRETYLLSTECFLFCWLKVSNPYRDYESKHWFVKSEYWNKFNIPLNQLASSMYAEWPDDNICGSIFGKLGTMKIWPLA